MKSLRIKVTKKDGRIADPYINNKLKIPYKKQRNDKILLNNITTIRNVIVNKKPTYAKNEDIPVTYKRPKSNRQTRLPSMAQCMMLNILPKDMEKMMTTNKGWENYYLTLDLLYRRQNKLLIVKFIKRI